MKNFFLKKYITGAVFILSLLLFSITNAVCGRETIQELLKELFQVENTAELKVWIDDVEMEVNEEIQGRMMFIETYGYMQKLLGKREFNNFAFIKGDDGMLYYGSLFQGPTDDLEEYAKRVRRLNDYVESRGAKLIVLLPPSKILDGITDVNLSWPLNNPNYRIDKFLSLLQQNGVTAMDLRNNLKNSGLALEEMFLKTDHHWTPRAGFTAVQGLVELVRERYQDDWDPEGFYCSPDNYHSRTFEKCMLGSTGRNTGAVYSGLDDYTLLWPEFETEFTWEDYEHEDSSHGDFTHSLLDLSCLDADSLYVNSINRVYINEIVDKDRITNHKNPEGPRIKALRDSYFSPMACFLAPMCSEIDMMWGRGGDSPEEYEEFIEEGDYDYFILEVYPYNLDDKSFQFFISPE